MPGRPESIAFEDVLLDDFVAGESVDVVVEGGGDANVSFRGCAACSPSIFRKTGSKVSLHPPSPTLRPDISPSATRKFRIAVLRQITFDTQRVTDNFGKP